MNIRDIKRLNLYACLFKNLLKAQDFKDINIEVIPDDSTIEIYARVIKPLKCINTTLVIKKG